MDFPKTFFLFLFGNAFFLSEICLTFQLGLYLFALDHLTGEIGELNLEAFTHVLLGVCIPDDDVVEILASHCALKFCEISTIS